MHTPRLVEPASELLRQVLSFARPTEAVLADFWRQRRNAGARDRARLADAVFDVLRRRRWYEHMARQGAAGHAPPAATPLERKLALLALYAPPAESAPDDAPAADAPEALAPWLRASHGADPATLPEACRHNLPDWLAQALRAERGEADFWPLAQALLQPAPLDLRVNTLKAKRPAVAAALAQAAIEATPTPYAPWGLRVRGKPSLRELPAWREGLIEVQDEGSQLLALLLDARRGQMVADFCAGAGGKTLALGAAMRGTGMLWAIDTSAPRLAALAPRWQRSGLPPLHTLAIAHEGDARLQRLAGKMDRVLVDAPCSGLGTLRRQPELKWRQTPDSVAEYAALQARILEQAARLLKPGGELLYATCSLLRAENEDIAAAFGAAGRSAFEPLPVAERLARLNVPGAETLVSAADGDVPAGQHLRLWPHRHGSDGFFAAIWRRC